MPNISMIKNVASSNFDRVDTPLSNPTLSSFEQMIIFKHVQQFMKIFKIAQATQAFFDSAANSLVVETQDAANHQFKKARIRASKLKFKTVNEVNVLSELTSMNSTNLLHAVEMLRFLNTKSLNL